MSTLRLVRSRDGEADEEAAEEDGREAERPWLANHIMVKIIDKKLHGGRCVIGNLPALCCRPHERCQPAS